MPNDRLDLHQLKKELSSLRDVQTNITKQAVFGGMSPAEAKDFDARQQRIMQIVATLERESSKAL